MYALHILLWTLPSQAHYSSPLTAQTAVAIVSMQVHHNESIITTFTFTML